MKLTIVKQTDFSHHPCELCFFRGKECPSYDDDPICLFLDRDDKPCYFDVS